MSPFESVYAILYYRFAIKFKHVWVHTCNRLIRTKYVQISQNIIFLWNPSVALGYCFSSWSQWSILPVFLDWSQNELELQKKLIARCKIKRTVPESDYLIFISWLPEGFRFYVTMAGHKFDLACVINWTMKGTIWSARLKYTFYLVSLIIELLMNNISRFLSIWGQWPDLGSLAVSKPVKPSTRRHAFSRNERYANFCFVALGHLGAILPELAK